LSAAVAFVAARPAESRVSGAAAAIVAHSDTPITNADLLVPLRALRETRDGSSVVVRPSTASNPNQPLPRAVPLFGMALVILAA